MKKIISFILTRKFSNALSRKYNREVVLACSIKSLDLSLLDNVNAQVKAIICCRTEQLGLIINAIIGTTEFFTTIVNETRSWIGLEPVPNISASLIESKIKKKTKDKTKADIDIKFYELKCRRKEEWTIIYLNASAFAPQNEFHKLKDFVIKNTSCASRLFFKIAFRLKKIKI